MWSYGKILLLAGALAATFFLFAGIAMRVAIRARQVAVPDLSGKTVAEATTLTSPLELELRVDEARRLDPKVPSGAVIGQDPAPGSPVRRHRSIRVWLSAGAKIARIIDHLLTHHTSCRDLSPQEYRQRVRARELAAMRKQPARLGLTLVESQA